LQTAAANLAGNRPRLACVACSALLLSAPLAIGAETTKAPDASATANASKADTAAIDRYITAQAKLESGEEYREARQRIDGDLVHDGSAETVVLYTIEGQGGSNNHVQYLAVFAHRNGSLQPIARVDAGGKSARGVTLVGVDAQGIALATQEYADGDPSCCPSRKGNTHFVLEHDKLVERRP
jgi:hypothetical protein